MSAELGSTDDPRALVPGSPDTIVEHVRTLLDQAKQFEGVGSGLAGFGVPGWQGAASDAFGELVDRLPPQWLKAADSLAAAAGGLSRYADTLRWAQEQAREAIELWNDGRRALERAAGQAAEDAAEEAVRQGEQLQQQARGVLDRARDQLEREAVDAARVIGTIEAAAGSAIGGLVDAITSGWDASGSSSIKTWEYGNKFIPPEHGKLGRYRYYAYLLHQVAEGKLQKGDLTLTGKVETMVGIETNLQAALNNKGLILEAETIDGVKSTATGRLDYGVLGLDGKAEGMFGVRGRAGFKATKEAVEAKAGVFAGARGSVRGAVDVGGVGAGATAEGWAGLGAEAGFTVGKGEDGKFHIKGNAGAALGIGGEVGFDLQVDGHKVAETAKSAANAVGDGIEAAGEGIKDFGEDVVDVGKSVKGLFG
ncbi:putative T7SS-secreted protein [Amycolatopsis thermoflava]|uniref:putative T7SS-secreted protein n=1 Tax=Amycolatopsis thermoflava TaxID=84480 RepID=UPI003EBC4710